MFPRFNVLGVGVHAACLRQTLTFLMNATSEKEKGYVCTAGVEALVRAHDDSSFRNILNQSLLTVADDCRVATVGRLSGHTCLTPVDTNELMLQLCRRSSAHALRHFFIGSAQDLSENVKTRLQATCPDLRVVGTAAVSDAFSAADEATLVQHIRSSRPDIIWVSLQPVDEERFMARCLPQLGKGVMIGVGSAFERLTSVSANSARAYRKVAGSPSLLRRHLFIPIKFTMLVLAQIFHLRRYDLPSRSQSLPPSYSLPRAA